MSWLISPLVPHICVNESGQHWFRLWLDAYPAPSHYLNQWWIIVNGTIRNKLQWNFDQNTNLSIMKMHLKIPSARWRPFCSGGSVKRRHIELGAYDEAQVMPLQPVTAWQPLGVWTVLAVEFGSGQMMRQWKATTCGFQLGTQSYLKIGIMVKDRLMKIA